MQNNGLSLAKQRLWLMDKNLSFRKLKRKADSELLQNNGFQNKGQSLLHDTNYRKVKIAPNSLRKRH